MEHTKTVINAVEKLPNQTYVGVVGYCPPTRFDEVRAREMIVEAYGKLQKLWPDKQIVIVSGMTDVGVLRIAYQEAVVRRWQTIGVACARAMEHPLFPVDKQVWAGNSWGDESSAFLDLLDAIVRIGTGKQSLREAAWAKAHSLPTIEYDLPALV